MTEAQPHEASRVALERFVAENNELLDLEQRLGRFNIFDALGLARAEIRHSNFLAWLLDPAESHGQGDLFLKAILMDLLRQAPTERRPLSPVEIDGAELVDVDVHREWSHIDLLIHARHPEFVIAIENKMHGGERSEKLERYEQAVAAAFPRVPALFVFLNPDGDDAPDGDWCAYSYRDVHRVLRRARDTAAGAVGTDVGVVLDHYLRLLETRLMDDPKIAELCRLIYKNHKQAIDLINKHGIEDDLGITDALAQHLIQPNLPWLAPRSNRRWIGIIPRSWTGVLRTADGSPNASSPLDCWVEADYYGTTSFFARIRLVIGPSPDPATRLRVIDALKAKPYNLAMVRKEPSATYTRLQAETLAKWNAEDSAPVDRIKAGAEKWLRANAAALDAIPKLAMQAG